MRRSRRRGSRRLSALCLIALCASLVGAAAVTGGQLVAHAKGTSSDLSPSVAGAAAVVCAQGPNAWTSSSSKPTKGCGAGKGYCGRYGGHDAEAAYGFDNVWACSPSTTLNNTPFDQNGNDSFQCVELSARFLWAVYGIYAGPGVTYYGEGVVSAVFNAYHPKVSEATSAGHNVPAPGDVISFGPGGGGEVVAADPVGHTAVVVQSNAKKGTFTIMSENMSSGGSDGAAGIQYLQIVPNSGKQVSHTVTSSSGKTETYTQVTQEGWVDFLSFGEAQAEWLIPNQPARTSGQPPLVITTPATASSPPNATVGQPYGFDLEASGPADLAGLYHKENKQLYFWSLVSGKLPAGLTLTSSGAIFGTPTAASRGAPFTVKVTAGGQTAEQTYAIWVSAPPASSSTLAISTPSTAASPPNAIVGDPYSFAFQARGGSGDYSWSISSGSLPQGLALASDGEVSGTPAKTTLGQPFTAQVSSGSATASATFTIWAVPASQLQITTADTSSVPPNADVGTPYSFALTATGGTGQYQWSLVGPGTLPAGVSLSPTGVISGTATEVGSGGKFEARVLSGASAATKEFTIVSVAGPPPKRLGVSTVSDAQSPPNASVGVPYAFALSASGGQAPYTWSLAQGSLPPGLTLASDGVISGVPTAVSKSGPFTVQVDDPASDHAQKAFTIWTGPASGAPATLSHLLLKPFVAVPAHALPGTSTTYYGATCPSAERCYVVGAHSGEGIVTATTNAGGAWSSQTIAGTADLYAIACPTADTCYAGGTLSSAAGYAAAVYYTTDGGAHWVSGSVPAAAIVDSIGCGSAGDCLAVGYDSTTLASSVIVTQDGGATWESEAAPTTTMARVNCIDDSHCWAAGPGAWFTANLGASWQDESPPNGPAVAPAGYFDYVTNDIEFQSPSDGWVVGGYQCGGVGVTSCPGIAYRTTDGGASWVLSSTSRSLPFSDQIACAGVDCLIVGQGTSYSEIAYTTNDGRTWVKKKRVGNQINALACTPQRTYCVAAGGNHQGPALLSLG